jgi:hypothetical protein
LWLARSRSSTYWSKVQLGFSSRNVHKFTARASLKMVGEFLNLSGSPGYLCFFFQYGMSSHSKANRSCLTRARQRQKKVSFRSREVSQLACGGRRLRRVYRLGTIEGSVTMALLTACMSWTGQ